MLLSLFGILPLSCSLQWSAVQMKKFFLMLISLFAFSGMAYAVVDLNTADQAQLQTVKGIGPAKAKTIIEYRTKNGAFKSVDELTKVSGFGEKSVTKMKGDLTVGGAAPAAATKPAAAPAPAAAKPAEPVKKP